jgi:rhamnosyltransferase subunit B
MKILVTVFGSLGDLFPNVGLARGLQVRGHDVRVASHACYRPLVEAAGLPFVAVRPDYPQVGVDADLMRNAVSGATHGLPRIFQRFYIPRLPETFADLVAAAQGVDGLVAACNSLAAPFVARRLGLPWVSCAIAPMQIGSRVDFSIIPIWTRTTTWLKDHGKSGRFFTFALRLDVRRWMRGVNRFGRQIGIPVKGHPMYEWAFSPYGNLGMFPSFLAEPQPPDWPANTRVTGFIPWQGPQVDPVSEELSQFLAGGSPPVVFTLGTWAVGVGRDFYLRSAEACLRLGQRAVLLVGREAANRAHIPASPLLHVAAYAPHAALFPRARLVVNHGGMGSVCQTLLARRPLIIVPHGLDQFDNAYRLRRQGVSETILPDEYTTDHLTDVLRHELANTARQAAVERTGAAIAGQDGVAAACDAVEEMLGRGRQ